MIDRRSVVGAFTYEPETGVLRWRRNGKIAGGVRSDGRGWQVTFKRKIYLGHRLIWFMQTGEWPSEIDHCDRNPLNNAWADLRIANRQQNNANTSISKRNSTGFKGVYQRAKSRRFTAQIKVNQRGINLGSFKTDEDAHEAYKRAAHSYFGEYARFV